MREIVQSQDYDNALRCPLALGLRRFLNSPSFTESFVPAHMSRLPVRKLMSSQNSNTAAGGASVNEGLPDMADLSLIINAFLLEILLLYLSIQIVLS